MPIGNEEWESGTTSDTFKKQILSFLRKNQDTAYTLPEIIAGLGYALETWEVLLVGSLVFGCFKTP